MLNSINIEYEVWLLNYKTEQYRQCRHECTGKLVGCSMKKALKRSFKAMLVVFFDNKGLMI